MPGPSSPTSWPTHAAACYIAPFLCPPDQGEVNEYAMNARFSQSLPPPAPLQAAIYARVSSDQQAERHTIDSQISDLKARAARDGHAVPNEYLFIDNGVSGAGLIRPALERLRDLIALSAIDLVYIHGPDRLARSYAHQVLLIEEFTRAGTRVVFLNRPIADTPEDTLLLQLQ